MQKSGEQAGKRGSRHLTENGATLIVGFTKMNHLEEVVEALEVELGGNERQRLEEVYMHLGEPVLMR